jgi:hypothetical protein
MARNSRKLSKAILMTKAITRGSNENPSVWLKSLPLNAVVGMQDQAEGKLDCHVLGSRCDSQ